MLQKICLEVSKGKSESSEAIFTSGSVSAQCDCFKTEGVASDFYQGQSVLQTEGFSELCDSPKKLFEELMRIFSIILEKAAIFGSVRLFTYFFLFTRGSLFWFFNVFTLEIITPLKGHILG